MSIIASLGGRRWWWTVNLTFWGFAWKHRWPTWHPGRTRDFVVFHWWQLGPIHVRRFTSVAPKVKVR